MVTIEEYLTYDVLRGHEKVHAPLPRSPHSSKREDLGTRLDSALL